MTRSHGTRPSLALAAIMLSVAAVTPAAAADPFDSKPGDHICIIGNTLADRMQHDGWLETLPPQPASPSTTSSSATSASPATS